MITQRSPFIPYSTYLHFIPYSAYLLTFVLTLCASTSIYAKSEVPCFEYKDGKWTYPRGKKCLQYTEEDQKEVNKRYLRLRYYMKEYQPKVEKKIQQLKELDLKWKLSSTLWKEKETIFLLSVDLEKKKAKAWKDSFEELKKKKAPKDSWTRHPALWVAVGVVGTVLIVVGVSVVMNKVQTIQLTSQSLRMQPGFLKSSTQPLVRLPLAL